MMMHGIWQLHMLCSAEQTARTRGHATATDWQRQFYLSGVRDAAS
jgi:hypothetical protein